MELQQRINAFAILGDFLGQFAAEMPVKNPGIPENDRFYSGMLEIMESSHAHNAWFTPDNLRYAFRSWSQALSEANLKKWVSNYSIKDHDPKTIGIVMAGNVPLVGFHDFLSVLITGNKVHAKLSSNDKYLLPFLAEYLQVIAPDLKGFISFTEGPFKGFDAVIATGSNNTARYFEYYFEKYPHIIRKNRNAVAVLNGKESKAELKGLANDIFRYFGLGCRNVSKLFVPEGYNFDAFFNAVYEWKEVIQHNKYINNYDYNKAIYLMSNAELLDNEFLLLKKDFAISSPISVVFYETYSSLPQLEKNLETNAEAIQCIVANGGIKNEVGFGKAQIPELWDYADGIDTVAFLLKITG